MILSAAQRTIQEYSNTFTTPATLTRHESLVVVNICHAQSCIGTERGRRKCLHYSATYQQLLIRLVGHQYICWTACLQRTGWRHWETPQDSRPPANGSRVGPCPSPSSAFSGTSAFVLIIPIFTQSLVWWECLACILDRPWAYTTHCPPSTRGTPQSMVVMHKE